MKRKLISVLVGIALTVAPLTPALAQQGKGPDRKSVV